MEVEQLIGELDAGAVERIGLPPGTPQREDGVFREKRRGTNAEDDNPSGTVEAPDGLGNLGPRPTQLIQSSRMGVENQLDRPIGALRFPRGYGSSRRPASGAANPRRAPGASRPSQQTRAPEPRVSRSRPRYGCGVQSPPLSLRAPQPGFVRCSEARGRRCAKDPAAFPAAGPQRDRGR